jgi:hypothetical protein
MGTLRETTLVPLSFAVLMIGGGAGWVTRQEIFAAENREKISILENKFEGIDQKLSEISEKLGRIEWHLKKKGSF